MKGTPSVTLYLTIHVLLVLTYRSTCTDQPYTPAVYQQSECTSSGGLWYILPSRIEECIEACVRQTKCLSMNYNRRSALCILRDTEVEQPPRGGGNTIDGYCYHMVLRELNVTALFSPSDPCVDRPCTNQSVCESSGTSGEFTCRLIHCDKDDLPTMSNARIQSIDSTKIGNTNAYICDSDYTMFGDSRIRCQPDGNWSSVNFTCYKNCPGMLTKTGSVVTGRSRFRLCYKTNVTYECKPAFYTFIDAVITCQDDGSWTEFDCFPYCTQHSIPALTNGVPTHGTRYTIRDRASYVCNHGYYLSPGDATVACHEDGTWAGPTVKCWKYCTVPTVTPEQSVLTSSPLSQYTNDTTITFGCQSNHYPNNSDTTATCTTDGSWAGMDFRCYKYCTVPTDIPAKSVITSSTLPQYTNDMTIAFECDECCYPDNTDTKATCNPDGSWTGMNFRCNTNCEHPSDGEYASFLGFVNIQYTEIASGGGLVRYTIHHSVEYRCLGDGTLKGNSRRNCDANGVWSDYITCCYWALYEVCCKGGDCKI